MRDENHFVAADIMEHAIVVLADAVAVPMDEESFDGGKVDEAFDIEKLFEPGEALDHVGLASGLNQALEIGAVIGVFAAINFESRTHFPTSAAVVKVSLRGSEVALYELFVGALDEYEQTKVAAIDGDERMTGPRRGRAQRVEEVAGELLAEVAGVLDGIVEVDLGEAVKALAGSELVEIEGKRRLGIDRLKGKGALEMNSHVRVDGVAFVNGNWNVDAFGPGLFPDLMVLLQNSHAFGRDLDAKPGNACGPKKIIGDFARRMRGLADTEKGEKDGGCERLVHCEYLDGNDPEFADIEINKEYSHMKEYTLGRLESSMEL